MNPDNNIEDILTRARNLALSSDEKSIMKRELLTHAERTLVHDRPVVVRPWSVWFARGGAVCTTVLLLFSGTAYASLQSLPGEPLYAMKVHVAEEIIGATKFTDEEMIAYDISLMETRLSELKEVTEQKRVLAPEDLSLMHEQIEEHTTDSLTAITQLGDDTKVDASEIQALTNLLGVTEAQEKYISQNESLVLLKARVRETKMKSSTSLESTVARYVSDTPREAIMEYFDEVLSDVSNDILTTEPDELSQDVTRMKLGEASDALSDGQIDDAIIFTLEAQQEIVSEKYLEDTDGEDETL